MSREYLFRGKRVDNGEWVPYWEFNKYGVNTDGQVCSFDYNHRNITKEIRSYKDKDGYRYVYLVVNGKRYRRFVHRMVLSTFVVNEFNKPQVNHKNGIRDDNRLENLEWVTAKENCIHAYKVNGRKNTQKQIEKARKMFAGVCNPKHKINEEIAINIINDRKKGLMLKDLALKYELSISQCSAICNGKFWRNAIDNKELLGE